MRNAAISKQAGTQPAVAAEPKDTAPAIDEPDVAALLGEPPHRAWWRRPATWIGAAIVIAIAAGGLAWRSQRIESAGPHYITQPVTRGDIALTVTANGTLQPTRSVNIGSELSGTVSRVFVDVNDRVKKGEVLLELDTAKLRDQIVRSRAAVASAEAKVAQAAATVAEARGNLARLEEVARLSGGKVPSQTELETGRATLTRATADEASARASVADTKAALSSDETNLGKAAIRSPIDGVVLTRSVEPGNAVAASLQAVTLFTIAEDLHQMRLQVNVDEADVGAVKVGQPATFTVSAYPNRQYPAKITRVAYGSSTTDNVVTYVTYLDVTNDDLTLRPGMTATATIAASVHRNVLRVPSSALRFTPLQVPAAGTPAAETPAADKDGSSGIVSKLMPRFRPRSNRRSAEQAGSLPPNTERQLWVLRDGKPVAVAVRTGISDGRLTEVESVQEGALQAGMQAITDQTGGTG